MKYPLPNCLMVLLAIIVMASCSKDSISPSTDSSVNFKDINFSYSSFEMDVLAEVNRIRSEEGLSTLQITNAISAEALEHNMHMLEEDEICHHNFAERSSDLIDMMSALTVGENVAYGEATAETVVQAWLDSDGHRKNLFYEDYTHFGISIVQEDEENFYFTNIFVVKN